MHPPPRRSIRPPSSPIRNALLRRAGTKLRAALVAPAPGHTPPRSFAGAFETLASGPVAALVALQLEILVFRTVLSVRGCPQERGARRQAWPSS